MAEWTAEEILQQAQLNLNVTLLAIIAYAKQRGPSIDDWATFAGNQFAPGWDRLRDASALEIARVAVFNPVTFGAKLISLEGDDKQATAVFDFAIEETARDFGVSVDEFSHTIDVIYDVIFAYLGIIFSSQRDGERWTYHLEY